MKKQKLDLEQIQENAQKLRQELESQIALISNYCKDFDLIEATEYYFKSKKGKEKFIDFNALEFEFKKYFLDVKSGGSVGRRAPLNKEITEQLSKLFSTAFKGKDYVLVICNSFRTYEESTIKQIYEEFKKNKVGKLTVGSRGDDFEEGFVLGGISVSENGKERVTVNHVKFDVCNYEGDALAGQNILLIGDEFGQENALTKLITESKPKSVLNLMIGNGNTNIWLDNID